MYSYKDIWRVSYPIMLGLLAQNVVQVTAMIFLGYVGEIEQSAVGLAGIYYIAFFTICFGFSIGGQIMIGRRNGEQNYNQIGTIVIQGIIFLEVLALILCVGSVLSTEYILPNFIQDVQVYEAIRTYLSWRILGLFFSSFNVMFRAFYIGIARTPVLTMNAIVMAVVNLVLDYGLIFGKLGMPEMGVKGAGIAAVCSEIASVLFFVIYTQRSVNLKKYGFYKMKFDFSIVKRILKISSFTMLQNLISISTWFIFFIAIEHLSVRALAITNVVRVFYMLFFIPLNAYSTSANTLVSNTMGANRVSDVIPLIKRICIVSVGSVLLVMIAMFVAPEFWVSLVASNESATLAQETVPALLVVVAALPILSISTVLFSAISGTGNTKDALILEVSVLIAYVAYMYWIVIVKQAPVAVCWTVEYVYWGGIMLISMLYFKYAKWQIKKV